jgi:uncharacterized protein with beta-barrel porin domain
MSLVKHTRLLVIIFVLTSNWSPTSFAQRQTAVGPAVIPLLPTGVQNGVDMSASGTTGTLSVGVLGGPEMDIFSTNATLASPFLAVSTAASSQGNIVFNSSSTVFGAIGMTPPGGPFLLNIFGGANGTVVNFQGPVQATTFNITGTGTVNFNSGSINNLPNGLIYGGDGTIGLAPNTTVIGALTTTAGTNTGTLNLGAGSTVTGAVGAASASLKAVNVVGGSNTAGVSATISGAVNAYSFSLGTNTLNVGGALTIADSTSTGLVNTTLASPTLFGNIRPVGFTTIGPTLTVNVTVPSTAVIPVGTQFNIIQTQTGTSQSGSQNRLVVVTIQDPTNPLYTFSQVPLTGTPAGLVTIVTDTIPLLVPIAPPPGVTLPPVIPVAAPIVPVLLGILASPAQPPEITQALAAIGALSDPAAVVNAVAQLAPSVADLAAPLVTFQVTRQFENLWMSHLDEVMCRQTDEPTTADSVCHANEPRAGTWMKGFGYFGSQGSQGAFGGYNSNSFGTMIGYDAPLNHAPFNGDTRVGFGIGYARSTINDTMFSANTSFNTYQATAYIAHETGPWFVDGDLSFGWNDYSGTRNIVFPGFNQTARANYSGQDYVAFLTTGYHLFTQGFTITPFASLQYTHMNLGGYGETGAGGIDLNVQSQGYDFLESGLGVKVARPLRYQYGTFVPEVHGRWLHDFVNPSVQNTAAFAVPGSSTFTTPGLKTASDTLNIGAGLTFLSCACTARTWSLEAIYDFFWRDDRYSANQATLRFTTRF